MKLQLEKSWVRWVDEAFSDALVGVCESPGCKALLRPGLCSEP